MTDKIAYVGAATLLFGSSVAFPVGGGVTITSPPDGFTVDSRDAFRLSYEAEPREEGEHLHLNVDDRRVEVVRPLKGNVSVGPLPRGRHKVCLVINTKAHTPTGVEQCINVTSK